MAQAQTSRTWKAIAADFNSPFIRNYIWTIGLGRYQELADLPSPILGIVCSKDSIEYIADLDSWTAAHEDLVKRASDDNGYVEKLIDLTNAVGEEFNAWSEKHIHTADLTGLTNDQLISLLTVYIDKQSAVYTYGSMLPTLDFGGFAFVEGNLKKILESRLPKSEYQDCYEVLTEPIRNSFAQDQEEDLWRLMAPFYPNRQWREGVVSASLNAVASAYPDFYELLKTHTRKHAWVYYVFSGPAYTEKNFLQFIQDNLRLGIPPEDKLREFAEKKNLIAQRRTKIIDRLQLTPFEEMILRLVGKFVWAKPRRKDYQSKSYYHLEKLLREIGRRLNVSLNQARAISPEDLPAYLSKGDADIDVLNATIAAHACLPDGKGGVVVLRGAEAIGLSKRVFRDEELLPADQKELMGVPAYKGKVRGIVKVINLPSEMSKMEDGNILVSLATTPSIVPAMKKAAGIVTDEGGLTCHASIVSRELETPCIVGTKFGSRVLKDGDEVEVDANRGLVRILSA